MAKQNEKEKNILKTQQQQHLFQPKGNPNTEKNEKRKKKTKVIQINTFST